MGFIVFLVFFPNSSSHVLAKLDPSLRPLVHLSLRLPAGNSLDFRPSAGSWLICLPTHPAGSLQGLEHGAHSLRLTRSLLGHLGQSLSLLHHKGPPHPTCFRSQWNFEASLEWPSLCFLWLWPPCWNLSSTKDYLIPSLFHPVTFAALDHTGIQLLLT